MKKFTLPKLICIILLGLLPIPSLKAQVFVNPLPIPYLIDSDTILLRVDSMDHNFNPNGAGIYNANMKVLAYNHLDSTSNTILGPSLVWNYKHQVYTEVHNNLRGTITTHWHGAHVPPHCDGNPHQPIAKGSTWKIGFDVKDKSATMWYHPHVMDSTFEQVQLGMSGMLYVADPPDGSDDPILTALHAQLPHSYNVDDFPLIVQTKQFWADTNRNNTQQIQFQNGYKSNYQYLVNGVMNPFLTLPQQMVRLRILNGDAKFAFNLGIGNQNQVPRTFQLIATDAGYTDSSYARTSVIMGPGERTEWLLDLSGAQLGDTLYLLNQVSSLPDGTIGDGPSTNGYARDTALLQFIVGPPNNPSPALSFPMALHPLETPPNNQVTRKRNKTFLGGPTAGVPFSINNHYMDINVINDTILLDSTEDWTLRNATQVAHPFHIHDIHFWVTKIKDKYGNSIGPDSLPYIFKGPKDNVLVMPGWQLTFRTTFDDFGGPIDVDSSYMMHCHILPHEDKGMMGQFVVWDRANFPLETVEPLWAEAKMSLYPNPARDRLHLQGKSTHKSQLRIIDLHGRVLQTHNLPPFEGIHTLSVENFARGLIIVEWTTHQGVYAKKVVLR